VGSGWSVFRSRFKTLVSILLVAGLPSILLSIGVSLLTLFPKAEDLLRSGSDSSTFLIALIAGFGVLILVGIILYAWGIIALMHAVASPDDIEPGAAFKRALSQLLSFGWLWSLMLLVSMGVFLVGFLAPLAVVSLLQVFTAAIQMSKVGMLFVGFAVAFLVFILLSLVVSTWMTFSFWILVDQRGKGLQALALSKQMVRGRFWAILGRTLGASVLIVLPVILVMILLTVGVTLVIPAYGGGVETVISQIVTLVVYPVLFGAMSTLYVAAKQRDVSAAAPHGKGVFVTFAILGIVFLLLIIAAIAFGAFYLITALPYLFGGSGLGDFVPAEL
jgi:hypothetical protein